MRIKYQDDFISVMASAIQTKTDPKKLLALVDKLITEDVVIITKEELQPIADLLGQLSDRRKAIL